MGRNGLCVDATFNPMENNKMISAKIIADSVSEQGKRLTTLELSYPRFIHGEIMTHRVFSRNAASSRAIPVKVMLDQVRNNPVIPIKWGSNQPGMQTGAEVEPAAQVEAETLWRQAAECAADFAQELQDRNIHKSLANRILEPFQWMKTTVTATEWDNFFELRDHPDAEIHFQTLAKCMRQAMAESTPVLRTFDPFQTASWHLPYVSVDERAEHSFLQLTKVSAARCARVSYLTHDGKQPDIEKDLALFDRLARGKPLHASPLEHQATPSLPGRPCFSNLMGWIQYRKLVEEEMQNA